MLFPDLVLNRFIGIRGAPEGAGHVLEMPLAKSVVNHLGTVHAAAQFALAEAASAELLLRMFETLSGNVVAVVRSAAVKYRKPATTLLRAFARLDDPAAEVALPLDVQRRGHGMVQVRVELMSEDGRNTFIGEFGWHIAKAA
jgi:acyl-coenzyme A thioesterase PaaI-like protein